jgi:CBS domain containing-hemolysin-like protein
MFVNIFASSIAEALGARIFAEAAELLSIAVMTVLLLIVGEMTPKNVAIRHSLRFSQIASRGLPLFHLLLRPVTAPLGRLRHAVLSTYPSTGGLEGDQSTAVLSAIRMGYQSNTIDESELHLLERFFRFRGKTAAEVMTPRVDADAVDASMCVQELADLIARGAISRETSLIPVRRADVDHITGYVRRVELAPYRLSGGEQIRLSEISHGVHAVPATKPLREVMQEMSEQGSEMAVVVDEYGGTEGVVSFPVLVAYLFEDFLPTHERTIEERADGVFRVAGHAEIGELAAALGVELDTTSRTAAGLVIERLGEIPALGHTVDVAGYRFTVAEVASLRIRWLDVARVES